MSFSLLDYAPCQGGNISNHVYGDAHSTPVRGENSVDYRSIESSKILSLEERSESENAGYTRKKLHNYGTGWCIVFFLMTFPFAMAGKIFAVIFFLILIIRSIFKLTKRHVVLSKGYAQATHVEDRRYKTGRRFAGDVIVEHCIKARMTPEEKSSVIRHGIAYVVIAFVYLYAVSVRSYLSPYYHEIVDQSEQQEAIQGDSTQDQESDDKSINL